VKIDWILVLAQVANFLILVFLLKRFLYDRILRVVDQRDQSIASKLAEAEEKQKQAQADRESCQAQVRELEHRRQQQLATLQEEVEEKRRALFSQLSSEVEEQRQRWQENVRQESQTFLQEMRLQTAREVCAVARQVLADLADVDLEQQLLRVLLQRIRGVDGEEIRAVLGQGKSPAVVRTRFEVPAPVRAQVINSLQEHLGYTGTVAFETDHDLVAGCLLEIDGRQLSWELGSYLDGLTERLTHSLQVRR
jgi:F-type H+-transporting ATPase subunit b